ncbi:hypothetical protein [Paenibacillus alvei]|uniref:hypothetical protein n=1 Tax=Paenibacillus TaxID=44249 RepID=UPI0022813BFF|nr:hypothetical protein [Paenibacillus alvei]
MFKRFTFSLLSVAMLLSIGTGSALAAQEAPKPSVKATKIEDVQPLATGSLKINWDSFSGNFNHNKVSVKNNRTGQMVVEHLVVTGTSITLHGLPTDDYSIWVGVFLHNGEKARDGYVPVAYVYANHETPVYVPWRY